jgi:uncharacterized phosphosugar-binding protein
VKDGGGDGAAGSAFWTMVSALTERLLSEGAAAIEAAALLMAERMQTGGQVFVYDTGHMLERELIHRAGGLVAWAPLVFRLELSDTLIHEPPHPVSDPEAGQLAGFVGYALDAANVTPRDVLLLASVTGARPVPVELALQARARRIPVVAITSPTFGAAVPARHPCGQRVLDLADVVIPNDCVVGDAAIHIDGVEQPVAPTSGITAAVLAWTLVERVARLLASRGTPPAVIASMNLPGATDRNREAARAFRRNRGA